VQSLVEERVHRQVALLYSQLYTQDSCLLCTCKYQSVKMRILLYMSKLCNFKMHKNYIEITSIMIGHHVACKTLLLNQSSIKDIHQDVIHASPVGGGISWLPTMRNFKQFLTRHTSGAFVPAIPFHCLICVIRQTGLRGGCYKPSPCPPAFSSSPTVPYP